MVKIKKCPFCGSEKLSPFNGGTNMKAIRGHTCDECHKTFFIIKEDKDEKTK